jgi:hypothetical protein
MKKYFVFSSIEKYVGNAIAAGGSVRFDRGLMFKSFGNFFLVFFGSFAIGSGMGCLTALVGIFFKKRIFELDYLDD